MGKIMLNEIDYSGGNANVIRLTQAEYDALPPTKLTDNNVYMITDVNGDGSQFQPVIYSEDEREIGVWVDGKTLYEKTFIYDGTINDNTWYHVNSDQTFEIKNVKGVFILLESEIPLPYYRNSWYTCYTITNHYQLDILMNIGDNGTGYVVTIQYTKTTDTAGSGTWTPQGVPAVHYSTDEKVVGTWVDGSTIYERTITFTNITIPKTGVKIGEIEIGDNIIEAQGHVIENGGMVYGIPELDLRWYVNNTDVLLLCYYASSWTIDSGELTIKYTKTSQGGN